MFPDLDIYRSAQVLVKRHCPDAPIPVWIRRSGKRPLRTIRRRPRSAELAKSLKPRDVLFCSNPRGNNEEGVSGDRYSCFLDLTTWRDFVTAAGFMEVRHYYRPPGLPRYKQWWLATVLRNG